MDILKEIKTEQELLAYAKVNGYGSNGYQKLKEQWEAAHAEPEPIEVDNITDVDIEDEY